MSDSPLPLYQALIDEYKSQANEPRLPDEHFSTRRKRLENEKCFEEIEDEEERRKKIDETMLAEFYLWLHKNKVTRTALCLSGGGIRSGTFALGLIQGLARHNLLGKFDYLSTVSGGGYIGSWLTAWIHRQPDGLTGVTNKLKKPEASSRIDPDPGPLRYLREYSSFITPKAGLLSADTWTFAGIYLRNLFLNWLVFIPLLVAAVAIPRLVVSLTLAQSQAETVFAGFDSFRARHILLALGFVLGVWALAYVNLNRPGVRELLKRQSPFWWRRGDQKSFVLYCLVPLVVSATFLTIYWAWSRELSTGSKDVPLFLVFGVGFTLTGWIIASFILGRLTRWREIVKLEVVALVVGGVLAGLFFWVMSHYRLSNPVIGYEAGFQWRTWSSWTDWTTEAYVCFGVPLFLLVFLLGATFFVGIASSSAHIDDEDREWWSRFGAWVLIVIILWIASAMLVIFGPIALLEAPAKLASVGGLSGLLAALLGRSSLTSAKQKPANERDKSASTFLAVVVNRSLPALALVFIASLVAGLSLATTGVIQGLAMIIQGEWLTIVPADPVSLLTGFDGYIRYIYPSGATVGYAKIIHMNVLHHTSIGFVLLVGLGMLGIGVGLSKTINLNIFSLHGGYRNRLIRAFLGASRPDHERNPNPFTGFDAADNIHMHELRPGLLDENDLIDPVRLAAKLKDDNVPMSSYLSGKNRLETLNANPTIASASPRLIASLRNDLNSVIESENLYALGLSAHFLRIPRIAQVVKAIGMERDASLLPEGALRGDYRLLLNRLILEEAYPGTLRPGRFPLPPYRLLHVVNTTLNLVGGKNLAWQQRKAEPFSISPLHSGCFRLGYRNSRDYGGSQTGGISLGTASAISGAAASSNMGYYTTSPVLSLLLTFFNVRLGWWLGNPGRFGNTTFNRRAPYSVMPLIDEAFGLTNDQNRYVYLTDGGHFENLAIYEMALRRCHIIIVSDGAQDEDYRFTDLGNAVRKIRIDLGVPIEFAGIPISAEAPPRGQGKGMYWAIGKIRYSCVDGPDVKDGILLYIKPAVYGDEPRDILEYKKSYPAFPHQSTADQFFDEPQFESYRMLGSFIMDELCGDKTDDLKLEEVVDKGFEKLEQSRGVDKDFRKWFYRWKDLPAQVDWHEANAD